MNGFLETVCQQGQYVGKGETLALVHPIEDAFGEPLLIESPGDGVIVSMRTSARVTYGDIILELACEVTKEDVLR